MYNAYEDYFRKLKSGEIAREKATYIAKRLKKGLPLNSKKLADFGKPKWANKAEYNSILFKGWIYQDGDGFKIPKIGKAKVFKDRMPDGKIKIARIKREHGNYYLTVVFESQSQKGYLNSVSTSESQAVGIDMGITYFAVDSNGKFTDNPRHTKKYEDRLRIKNREFARKVKGSVGFERTKREVNRLHAKIARVRKDFLDKSSTDYIKNNQIIVCEDLNVNNLMKNHNLSKHISDASWSKFFTMLSYKSYWYEKEFIQVNPKYTSQKCSCCGHIAKENRLTQSKFECVKCGHTENADFQASKVILAEGLKILSLGEGIALKRQREALACA